MLWYMKGSSAPHHWDPRHGFSSVPFVCMQTLDGFRPWKAHRSIGNGTKRASLAAAADSPSIRGPPACLLTVCLFEFALWAAILAQFVLTQVSTGAGKCTDLNWITPVILNLPLFALEIFICLWFCICIFCTLSCTCREIVWESTPPHPIGLMPFTCV